MASILLIVWLGAERFRSPRTGDVPFVVTRPAVVDRMLELAGAGPDDLVVDLGSGDGRIVLRAAERSAARGRGVELDGALVRQSRRAAAAAGLDDRVEFIQGDLFEAELADADVVTVYLLPTVNVALRPKLLRELAVGSRVVSQTFDMGTWRPDVTEVVELQPPATIHLWRIPAAAGGVWTVDPVSGAEAAGAVPRSPTLPPRSAVLPLRSAPLPSLSAAQRSRPSKLRLLQRFQYLEGELRVDDVFVPVVGALDGAQLQLEASRPLADGTRWRFAGTVRGDRIDGQILPDGDGHGAVAVAARREAAAITGEWEIGSGAPGGMPPWTLLIEGDEDGWRARRIGTGEGRLAGTNADMPIDELYVWGGSIQFRVRRDADAGPEATFAALIEGSLLFGTIDSGASTARWSGRRR